MTDAFIWDKGTPNQRLTSPAETATILKDIHNEIVNSQLIYRHKVTFLYITYSDKFSFTLPT